MPIAPRAWDAQFTANTRTNGVQFGSKVVQMGNGDFWVIWNDFDEAGAASATGQDIIGQRYNAFGERIGAELKISGFIGAKSDLATTVSPDGSKFFVTYRDAQPNGVIILVVESRGIDGTLINSTAVQSTAGSATTTDFASPSIAFASNGAGILVFERVFNGQNEIRAVKLTANGAIDGVPVTVANANPSYDPQVIVRPDGSYLVVYAETAPGPNGDLRMVTVSQQLTVSLPTAVATTADFEFDHTVTTLSNGGFVVAYTSQTGANKGDVIARVYNPNGTFKAQVSVATGTTEQRDPTVTSTKDGGFMVAYESGPSGQVIVSTYDANGAAVGAPLTFFNNSASSISLLGLGDGRTLLAFDDGDVKAQILDTRSDPNAPAYALKPHIVGTIDDDVIDASGATVVHGGDGNDTISDGGGTQAQVFGGEGNDTIRVSFVDASESFDGGAGFDTLEIFALTGPASFNLKAGTALQDGLVMSVTNFESFKTALDVSVSVTGTDGGNVIQTGGGNDVLDGGLGIDQLLGGLGNDTYIVESIGEQIIEFAGQGTDTVVTSLINYSLVANLENLFFNGIGSATLNGNSVGNIIIGGASGDKLFGFNGNDVLDGNGGVDTTDGGFGDDVHGVDNAADVVVERAGEGNDRVLAGVSYRLGTGVHIELLSAANQAGTAAMDLAGNESSQNVIGNDGINYLEGLGGDDKLIGLGGNDVLDGGAGKDTTDGGMGDDWHIIDSSDDVVIELAGGGYDRVITNGFFRITAGAEIELLTAANQLGTEALDLQGNTFNQTIFANDGKNFVEGFGGDDVLWGLGGDDIVDGGAGVDVTRGGLGDDIHGVDDLGDTVIELAGEGNDRVLATTSYVLPEGAEIELLSVTYQNTTDNIDLGGNSFDNIIFGNDGLNKLSGGAGQDQLWGLGGEDVLDGGAGSDLLLGGIGVDQFVFSHLGSGIDTIADFQIGQDKIVLSGAQFGGLGLGPVAAGAFAAGSTAQDADDRILYDHATGRLYYDADGVGGMGAIQFAQLEAGTILTASDFSVI
jgi:Ca2+-binding RTX toxin-like protein